LARRVPVRTSRPPARRADGLPGRAAARSVDRARCRAEGGGGARGQGVSAADRDELRGRVADRNARRLRSRRGRVCRRRRRCRRSAEAMIKNRTAILVLLTGLNFFNYIDRAIIAAVLKPIKTDLA